VTGTAEQFLAATPAAVVLWFGALRFWLRTLPGYLLMRSTERTGIV
jgi:hypothetical protein